MLSRYYEEKLSRIPPPGEGCHPYLLSVANSGVRAGIPLDQLFDDIHNAIPAGRRRVPDREILDAIAKAHAGGRPRTPIRPAVRDGGKALRRIIEQSDIMMEADLWESSPIRLTNKPERDPVLLLEALYETDDLLWIGEPDQPGVLSATIRPVREWINHFARGGKTAPHFIVNPLSGAPAPTKTGDKETLRGDANVLAFKYCLVEFDNLPREDQIRFWSAARLPIRALLDSGGKSIHALLDVQKMGKIETMAAWEAHIKGNLYERLLAPLGVDQACSNPSRMSRLPGHVRAENGNFQRILWLSPEARPIC